MVADLSAIRISLHLQEWPFFPGFPGITTRPLSLEKLLRRGGGTSWPVRIKNEG
jgi:hypothetical protein